MDMNLLYAILIALVPVIITVIMSRVYNIVHGVITFLVTGHLLMFCLGMFGVNLPKEIMDYTAITCSLYTAIGGLVNELLGSLGLAELLAGDLGVYILLAVFVVIFVVSLIFASVFRKKSVEKVNSLKRQVKRY